MISHDERENDNGTDIPYESLQSARIGSPEWFATDRRCQSSA